MKSGSVARVSGTARTPVQATRGRRLGEVLAEEIENEIIAAGWPVGTVLGSESDLLERYGVSRAVFREAMRIVDHHGVAEMRRGPGGGLVVVEPSLDAAVRTVLLNLEYLGIEPDQINDARLAIELSCVRSAIDNLDADGEAKIEAFLDGEVDAIMAGRDGDRSHDDFATNDFHLLIADLSGNPAMAMFVQILGRITSRHSSRADSLAETAKEVHRVHRRIAEAILTRDPEAAERRMRRHLDSIVGYLHR